MKIHHKRNDLYHIVVKLGKNAMRFLIYVCLICAILSGCDRDNDAIEAVGIVHDQQGCYPDSYLVEIVSGLNTKAFLCQVSYSSMSPYNCSNSVFIHLPADLAVAGKRIRFFYTGTEVSCFSSNVAPSHITVKSLRAD